MKKVIIGILVVFLALFMQSFSKPIDNRASKKDSNTVVVNVSPTTELDKVTSGKLTELITSLIQTNESKSDLLRLMATPTPTEKEYVLQKIYNYYSLDEPGLVNIANTEVKIQSRTHIFLILLSILLVIFILYKAIRSFWDWRLALFYSLIIGIIMTINFVYLADILSYLFNSPYKEIINSINVLI